MDLLANLQVAYSNCEIKTFQDSQEKEHTGVLSLDGSPAELIFTNIDDENTIDSCISKEDDFLLLSYKGDTPSISFRYSSDKSNKISSLERVNDRMFAWRYKPHLDDNAGEVSTPIARKMIEANADVNLEKDVEQTSSNVVAISVFRKRFSETETRLGFHMYTVEGRFFLGWSGVSVTETTSADKEIAISFEGETLITQVIVGKMKIISPEKTGPSDLETPKKTNYLNSSIEHKDLETYSAFRRMLHFPNKLYDKGATL